ncbi:transcriptional regulator TyrR, partial [Escherichia coli]|nr:transcriptional regulator TyrR [Escherichia coli]
MATPRILTGAGVMLQSTIRMGRQLQNVAALEVSAFGQISPARPHLNDLFEQPLNPATPTPPRLFRGEQGAVKIPS